MAVGGKKIQTLIWKLDADNAALKKKLNTVNSELDKTKKKGKQAFGGKLSGLMKASALALGGLILGFRKLIAEFAPFNTGMRKVNSILQLSEANYRSLGNEILEVQAEIGAGSKDLTDAAYQAVSAGVEKGSLVDFLKTAGKISVAGVATMTESVDILTSALNSYNETTDQAGRYSDILFQTIKLGKTDLSQLTQALSTVMPLAAANGIRFEELAAAIATLTKQGVKTPEAITQIRSAIIGMNQVLGDGWTKAMTFQDGVEAVRKKSKGSQNELKRLLGRIEGVNAVLGLTGQNAKTAADDLDAMNDSFGATQAAFEQNAKALEFRWNKFIGGITAGVIKATDSILNLVLPVDELSTKFEKASQNAKKQKDKFDTLAFTMLNLKEKINLTEAEQQLYNETIEDLQTMYPNYLKNIDFEKDGYEQIKIALAEAGGELDNYLNKKIKAAVLADSEAEIIMIGKAIAAQEIAAIRLKVEIDKARKSYQFQGVFYEDTGQMEKAIKIAQTQMDGFGVIMVDNLKEKYEELKLETAKIKETLNNIFIIEPISSGSKETIKANYVEIKEIIIESMEDIAAADRALEAELSNSAAMSWEQRKKALDARVDQYKTHTESMRSLAAQLSAAMVAGVVDDGFIGGLKQILLGYINFLEAGIVAATAASALKSVFYDFSGWPMVAAAIIGLETLKVAINSFAVGTENFGGGMAKVHKDEILQLPAGSNVYSKNESRQMLGADSGETNRLLRLMIRQLDVANSRVIKIKGRDLVEVIDKASANKMGKN